MVKKELLHAILKELNESTNLQNIKTKLKISKQQLNYYLNILQKENYIQKKGKGFYEVTNSTLYSYDKSKDSIRGHAYVWTIKIPEETKGWSQRIEILQKNKTNFKLVGLTKDIPRIKVLGRKIWLCNNHLRIFDKKDNSYYGKDARESRYLALKEIKLILNALNNKLGLSLSPLDINFRKEHYALIKNDLAIEENKKGNIWRIKDEEGEWLLIDDSLEQGGELENVGKDSFKTNIPMQKWWNDNKKHNFEVTPTFLLNQINVLVADRQYWAEHQKSHVQAIQTLSKSVEELTKIVKELKGN